MEIDRKEWLDRRREMITASDVPAILGVDPRRTALDVFEAKLNGTEIDDSDLLRWGRNVEGAIAQWYEHDTGRVVEDLGATKIQVHPDFPWLGATLDRWQPGNPEKSHPRGPAEFKAVSGAAAAEWREDEKPDHHLVQLQIQMACSGAEEGTLGGLLWGNRLKWQDFERNDSFLDQAYVAIDEFRERLLKKDPPAPESYKALDAMKRIWNTDNGELIAMDSEALELVSEWETFKAMEREGKKQAKEIEAKLRHILGEATAGALPDGRFLTLKMTNVDGYVKEVAAYSYRTLRIAKKF